MLVIMTSELFHRGRCSQTLIVIMSFLTESHKTMFIPRIAVLFQPCVVLGFLWQLRSARDDSCKLYNMNQAEIWNLNTCNMFA